MKTVFFPITSDRQLKAITAALNYAETTRPLMKTMDKRIARLLRQYHVGDRVRAVETIVYGTGEEIPEGSVGYVHKTNVHDCSPLVLVTWNSPLPPIPHPVSAESLEPSPLDPP